MERRRFIEVIAGGLLAAPRAAGAQPTGRVYRIGWLTPAGAGPSPASREAMRALGYVEGQTVAFESRSAEDDLGRLPRLAAELVHPKVDVIVAVSPPAIRAARQATDAIPIVMAYWGQGGLIESGIVASFASPGGNVTGLHILAAELDAKRLELLLQAIPKARKVGVLDPQAAGFTLTDVRRVAEVLGVQLHITAVGRGSEGYERAFDSMAKARVEALLVPSFPRFFRDAGRIIELAARRRIPAVYEWPAMAKDGGLMAYGPTFAELNGRVAAFVDRILKGAKPGDLPIEQPTKFELVINLKTAKALGLTVPPSLLGRADEVIQ